MVLARNIATVGGATLLSRVLGFARDAGIAALFGSSPFAAAFFAVLQFINFFRRLLAEGAVNGAFAPIWLRLRREHSIGGANRFTRRTLSVTAILTIVIATVCFLMAPLIVRLLAPGFEPSLAGLADVYFILAAPYITLAGLVAVLSAALNAEDRVGAVALGTIAFNAVLLGALAFAYFEIAPELTLAGAALAVGIPVAGLAQFLIVATVWLRHGKRFTRVRIKLAGDLKRFFRRAAPTMISAGIPQLKLLAGAAIASSSAAGVSWLYYANRLYELPLGVASVAIASVIVPRIAAALRSRTHRALREAHSRAFEIALGLALPATAGFALLAEPIAAGLFQRGAFRPEDTVAVAAALAAICGGLAGHVIEKVFAAISFAHEDAITPMLTALCGLAAAIAGGLLAAPHYGHVGVAAAIGVSGWVGAAVLGLVLAHRQWIKIDATAARRLPRIVLATAIMAAIVFVSRLALWPLAKSDIAQLAILGVLVSLGIAAYLALLQVLRVVRLTEITAALQCRD